MNKPPKRGRPSGGRSKGSKGFHARAMRETGDPSDALALSEDLGAGSEARTLTDEEIEARLDALRLRAPLPYLTTSGDYDWEKDPAAATGYTQEDLQAMVEKLSPRQRTYAAARVHGESKATACRMLRVAEATVKLWEGAPWYDLLLAQERARMFGDQRTAFEPLAPALLKHYAKAIDGEYGGEVAQAAARDVADRVFGKVPTQLNQKIEGDLPGGGGLTAFLREVADANRALREEQAQQAQLAVAEEVVEEAEWQET